MQPREAIEAALIDVPIEPEAAGEEPYKAQTVDQMIASRSPQVIQGMLYGLTVSPGGPNVGKSAFEVDMFAHIAAQLPFFGRKVNGGPVIIFAAEAPFSIVQRVKATLREKFAGRRLPLYICRDAPRLGDESIGDIELERVIATIKAVSSAENTPVKAVSFDTVAAILAGSDENGEGMLRLVRAALQIIERTGAAVLLLHHPSKADPDGLRGHSSLPAAADAIIAVTIADARTGTRRAVITKSRDSEAGAEFFFKLEPVMQPEKDEFGDPMTTVIVRSADTPPKQTNATGKNQQNALIALREYARSHPDAIAISSGDLSAMLKTIKIGRQRRPEVVKFLVDAGILTASIGGHTINREALS